MEDNDNGGGNASARARLESGQARDDFFPKKSKPQQNGKTSGKGLVRPAPGPEYAAPPGGLQGGHVVRPEAGVPAVRGPGDHHRGRVPRAVAPCWI
ncbi:hypothetical protein QJS66_14460 [Kocuria rhizophila]|nr:hypothetical protein QJS66_14460 [Kocuria rhizophila]